MLKSELIERIAAQNPHLYRQDAEKIVNAILDRITTALMQGDRVELRDFGVFTAKAREPHTKCDPRNGTKVAVPEKVFVAFKSSRTMHRRLNPSEEWGPPRSAIILSRCEPAALTSVPHERL
jgi:integration host factor subunit beta